MGNLFVSAEKRHEEFARTHQEIMAYIHRYGVIYGALDARNPHHQQWIKEAHPFNYTHSHKWTQYDYDCISKEAKKTECVARYEYKRSPGDAVTNLVLRAGTRPRVQAPPEGIWWKPIPEFDLAGLPQVRIRELEGCGGSYYPGRCIRSFTEDDTSMSVTFAADLKLRGDDGLVCGHEQLRPLLVTLRFLKHQEQTGQAPAAPRKQPSLIVLESHVVEAVPQWELMAVQSREVALEYERRERQRNDAAELLAEREERTRKEEERAWQQTREADRCRAAMAAKSEPPPAYFIPRYCGSCGQKVRCNDGVCSFCRKDNIVFSACS